MLFPGFSYFCVQNISILMKTKILMIFLICSFPVLCLWAEHSKYSFYYSQKLNEGISQLSVMTICQDVNILFFVTTREIL